METPRYAALVQPDALRDFVKEIFVRCGTPETEADMIADSLVEADLIGRGSHGVTRVKLYTDMIAAGGATAACHMEILRDLPGSALIDAHGALGIPVSWYAMQMAIKKAAVTGVAMVNVAHSNHCSASGYFTEMAAREGMIGMACSNAPSSMAPWGSRDKYLGTNPLAISIPTADRPLSLDMATSLVARGKILEAAKEGVPIPEGWAIDAAGRPTTDAQAALQGCVLPFGGAKGSGISMAIDIISGILSGTSFGSHLNNPMQHPEHPMDVGHSYMAIKVGAFQEYDLFISNIEKMKAEIKALRPASGVSQILLPGELEQNTRQRSLADGIKLPAAVYEELLQIAVAHGVSGTLESKRI